ncbi:hypothetical protein [Deinococcus puniceus]|uniref:Uncharacterized protein n=1 Tax=Deinococcus puniceus TaxID=1182568 RepID=A0A172T686_9DEIO|nr:hypothetical protein [Deinococcus puniceus]ANE42472.1 hypothetical protein SU48_00380 [Deinococcus puniceus]
MKVGLLESRAARLSGYWAAYLKELGVERAVSDLTDAEALALGQESLPGEPVQVQLALGRILALGRVDAVLVPQSPPVANDAWGEALTELLSRRFSSLPTLMPIPDGGPTLETVATEIGLKLAQNPGGMRLALERVKPKSGGAREDMPPLAMASRVTVAVIGPRSLLAEDILAGGLAPALDELGLHAVFSSELPVAQVLARAVRMEDTGHITAGERELFGAASLLSGKSAVRGVIFVAPARDAAHRAALTRAAARMHAPTLLIELDAGQTEWPELEAFRDRITLGAAARPAKGTTTTGDEPA